MSEQCLCQSNSLFSDCCEPYILGIKSPTTPEALMRSRYTAYALKNLQYIQDTMNGPASKGFDLTHALRVANDTHWRGLEVAPPTPPKENIGWVVFIAHYQYQNEDFRIFEKSEFRKENGKWYYYSGKKLNLGLIPKFFKDKV